MKKGNNYTEYIWRRSRGYTLRKVATMGEYIGRRPRGYTLRRLASTLCEDSMRRSVGNILFMKCGKHIKKCGKHIIYDDITQKMLHFWILH